MSDADRPPLAPETWARLLDAVDGRPTAGEVSRALADARELPEGRAYDLVVDALTDGPLTEEDTDGAFREVALDTGDVDVGEGDADASALGGGRAAADTAEADAEPGGSDGETTEDGGQEPENSPNTATEGVGTWSDADFTAPEAGAWPGELLDRVSWMGHVEKRPFAPWGDYDHPEADPDKDARWKWGLSENYVDGEAMAAAEDGYSIDGRVFLQQDADPYAFVDGDDVRCPETGEVHPTFVEILERLGITYGDVSTSGAGVHANYRGELPDGVKQAVFEIDDEPWGANDEGDRPTVEIYDGKHVCVATGEHVPGTPLEVNPWDEDALADVLDEYDQLPDVDPAERRESFDAEAYDAGATESDETTDELRDIFAALDRLDAREVADRTIVRRWIDPAGTENRAFVPTWAPGGYDGTANFAGPNAWTDTGARGGYGGPAVMAAIDCPDVSFTDRDATDGRVEGGDWFRAVDHLRELGFSIPNYVGGAKAGGEDEDPRDALEVDVTSDVDVALRAAGAVVPTDLERSLPLEAAVDDGRTGWVCPQTGEVVNVVRAVAIAEGSVSDADAGLDGGQYHRAYERAREDYGAPLPRFVTGGGEKYVLEPDSDAARELLGADVVVEPTEAIAAAGAVRPDDLDADVSLPELEREDVDDVAIAVALAEEWISSPDEFPTDGRYTEAYYRARERYGAPLPKYLDNTALESRKDLIYAALDRVGPEHILDRLKSDVTVEDPSGETRAKINPTWEESESGERILAGYGRGFWCAEHSPGRAEGDQTFGPLQVVALENGLLDDVAVESEREFTRLPTEAFKDAYTLLREEYDAPLPKWRATVLEHVAVLPPAVRLRDDDMSAVAGSETLEEARERTEALVRDAAEESDYAQLLTPLPGTGKTYSTVLAAADTPTTYLTRRNDLKAQVEDYAAEITEDDDEHPDVEVSVAHLPILAEDRVDEDRLREGVEAVREHGRDLLRDGDDLLEYVSEPEEDDETDDDPGERGGLADNMSNLWRRFDLGGPRLTRPTCPAAEGDHGESWRVRIQTARVLGAKPAEIHRADTALFDETLPCQADGHTCDMTEGWKQVRDPEDPADILVGSPGHAFVDSAVTHFSSGPDDEREENPRVVALDEFPGSSYFSQYGARYMDHAVWLAEALVDVDTREDLLEADLQGETWVDLWLDGDGAEYGVAADAIAALEAAADLAEASNDAHRLLENGRVDDLVGDTSANVSALRESLEILDKAVPDDDGALEDVADRLATIRATVETDAASAYADGDDAAGALYAFADELEAILDVLERGLDAVDGDLLGAVRERLDALPVGGDLRALLDTAPEAVRGDAPDGLLEAAGTALRGGRDGCRELALFADDGYAHPDAWAHLAGAIAHTGDDGDAREVSAAAFSFDPEREGGRFKRLQQNGAVILADKNHHGALVVDTPAYTDITGGTCPVLGLDATGRPELWRLAIGRDVRVRDIHDTDADRRRFLREVVDLRVVQTSDRPLPYHGSPDGKNFAEDLELVETVAEKYTGDAPEAFDAKGPAVISTKKVLDHLEADLDGVAGATVNYENMKGSDALGDHQVGVILGSQHYGDRAPEKWALLAGEDVGRGETRGAELDYGSDVANAYLRYMREDHVMQAVLRAGRNDEATVIFAHTGALRADLPVEGEGGVLSAHSKGTLAVAEAAAEFDDGAFTAREVRDAIAEDDRAVGLRQVQNVLATLRESGYLDVEEAPAPGSAGRYDLDEDPGRAEADLPELEAAPRDETNETSRMESNYTWNFVSPGDDRSGGGPLSPSRPVIPAGEAQAALAEGDPPT
jgi:hypothetical protein